jgi:hypothetical protein
MSTIVAWIAGDASGQILKLLSNSAASGCKSHRWIPVCGFEYRTRALLMHRPYCSSSNKTGHYYSPMECTNRQV